MSDQLVHNQSYLNVSIRPGRCVTHLSGITRAYVLVEIMPVASPARPTPPVDLRFVIDRSGSMVEKVPEGESKLKIVQDAIYRVLGELTAQDSVMLVSFNDRTQILFNRDKATGKAISECRSMLESLTADGWTFISEALGIAINPRPIALPRVIVFTDGCSTVSPDIDQTRLAISSREARQSAIPLSLYGTGVIYNHNLLQQMAVLAGNGSFCRHIFSMQSLEGCLLSEIAFMRGTAVDRLTVSGSAGGGVRIVSVTAMLPVIRELSQFDYTIDQNPRDHVKTDSFVDASGYLTTHHGQTYLVVIEIADPSDGTRSVLDLNFAGRVVESGMRIEQKYAVSLETTRSASKETPVDPEVMRTIQRVAAYKAVNRADFDTAARLLHNAGDDDLAQEMETLVQMSIAGARDVEDTHRSAVSLTGDMTGTLLGARRK